MSAIHRADGSVGRIQLVLRIAVALAVALLAVPLFTSSAFAEGEDLSGASGAETAATPAPDSPAPADEPAADSGSGTSGGDATGGDAPATEEPAPVTDAPVEEAPAEEAPAGQSPSKHGSPSTFQTDAGAGLAAGAEQLTTAALAATACDQVPQNAGEFLQNTTHVLANLDTTGEWVNGNINNVKGDLREGDFVWQWLELTEVPEGPNSITLRYSYMEAGVYGYDFLDHFTLSTNAFPILGGWTSMGAPVVDIIDADYRTATISWDQPAGSTTAQIRFGAHIASELDFGPGQGAGSINGSPYHVRLWELNCGSAPSMDNQIMVSAIPAGFLTIIKNAVPDSPDNFAFNVSRSDNDQDIWLDDDGVAAPQIDSLTEADPNPNSVSYFLSADTYTIAELLGANSIWQLTNLSCVEAGDSAASSDPTFSTSLGTLTATVHLTDDSHVVCTFTNGQVQPKLTLVKSVHNGTSGATHVPADWTLAADGPVDFSGAGNSAAVTDQTVQAGSYNLSEQGPGGYDASDWVCVGGTQDDADTVTLAFGDEVTCTITNTARQPHLTLVKSVDNGTTGATHDAGDWTLAADGPTDFSGAGDSLSIVNVPVGIGSYDLSESGGPGGYDASAWVCTGDGTQNDADTVTLGLGDDATCTITNTAQQPHLTLVKVVDNGTTGATHDAGDWTLAADGPTDFSGAGDSLSIVNVPVGIGAYDLSESGGPDGYDASAWVCTGDGTQNDADTVTLGLGDDATCTITNTAQGAHLTLVKLVQNGTTGSTADAGDWTLTADGPTTVSGAGDSLSIVNQAVPIGSYDLSENGLGGYDASNWICTGGTQDDADTVTLGLGDDVTCTITNTAQQPYLTLVKVVDNGTTGATHDAGDWTLTADGPTDVSGAGDSLSIVHQPVAIGSYDLSENGPAGYDASSWVCTGGDQTDANSVDVALGDDVTCTITNTAEQSHLTLVKLVQNGTTGATHDAGDWTLTADGPTTVSGAGDSSSIVNQAVPIGSYDLSENGAAGYDASNWICTGGDQTDGNTVGIDLGDDVTCTITNTAQQPHLTLVKVVDNGDTGATHDAGDWTLAADGPTDFSGAGDSLSVVDVPVAIGSYDLSENGPGGYDASNWVCTGGDQTDANSVDIALGDDVTCTITNTAQQPHLTLVKVVDNGDTGATHDAGDWTLAADGPTDFSGAGDSLSVVDVPVAIGSYDLSENGPGGYDASNWVCTGGDQTDANSVDIALGDDVTCTITNTAVAPQLTLVKDVDHNGTGDGAVDTDWTLTADGPDTISGVEGDSSITGAEVAVGSYELTESSSYAGYELVKWECTGDASVNHDTNGTQNPADDTWSVNVGLADDVTCEAFNRAIPSDWMVEKSSDPVSGSTVLPGSEIHYTVTVTRIGDGVNVFDVDVTDTLTGVEDSWVSGIQVAGDASALLNNGVISLHINELSDTVTLTYTVTVGDVWGATLHNVVTPGTVPCVDPAPNNPLVDCDETTHFTPHYVLDKSVELLASPGDDDGLAEPGERLTYTLKITNDTAHAILENVVVSDDVSDVLDNASMVDTPTELAAKGLLLSGDETELTWTVAGPIQPGASVQVTYTVEIDAHAWDVTLHNIATPGDGGECIPAGDLGPDDNTDECETTTTTPPVTTLVVEKQDLETQEVLAGAEFNLYLDNAPVGTLGAEDELIGNAVSDVDGLVKFGELQMGDYLVEESTPPAGYELPDEPVMAITIDAGNFVRGGEMTPIVFLDPTTGQIAIVSKQQFEFVDGVWEQSDGVVDFGDVVKYVVRYEATGPKNFYDVELSDYLPGYNPADTTSTAQATLIDGTAVCDEGVACEGSLDPATGLVTWPLGDLAPGNGETVTGTVQMVVTFPQAPEDPDFVDGLYTETLWNQAYLDYDEVVGGTPEAARSLAYAHHTLTSNEVTVAASLEEPPIEPPPPGGCTNNCLPNTGAQPYLGQLAALGGLVLALGLVLVGRARRKDENEVA